MVQKRGITPKPNTVLLTIHIIKIDWCYGARDGLVRMLVKIIKTNKLPTGLRAVSPQD
jgi:hypothetical protein